MGAPCMSTCTPWADETDLCSPCDEPGYSFDTSLMDDMLQAASDILFELSARRFPGSCSDTVRPCGPRSGCVGRDFYGRNRASWCGCRGIHQCGSVRLSQVTLGVYPVTDITEVKVDGEVLDPSLYRVDDFRWLVRLNDPDGSNPGWPTCQRMDLADTEDDTFAVTVTYGSEPPVAGRRAAAVLACQLSLACQPETVGECRLPRGLTQISRQGVDISILSPSTVEEMKAALPEVALFLDAYNRGGVMRRAVVASPDVGRSVRRVGT